ncbi:hypothetical protein D3C71_1575140 [compost metagenome]
MPPSMEKIARLIAGSVTPHLPTNAADRAERPPAVGGDIQRYRTLASGRMTACDQGFYVRHSQHLTKIAELMAEIEDLKAKHAECAEFIDQASLDAEDFEALRKDAERYRWLRSQLPAKLAAEICGTSLASDEDVDSGIDAELAKADALSPD